MAPAAIRVMREDEQRWPRDAMRHHQHADASHRF